MCVCVCVSILSFKQQFHILIRKHFKCDIISELKPHMLLNVKKSSVTRHLMHCYKLGGVLLEKHAVSKFSVIKVGGIMDL